MEAWGNLMSYELKKQQKVLPISLNQSCFWYLEAGATTLMVWKCFPANLKNPNLIFQTFREKLVEVRCHIDTLPLFNHHLFIFLSIIKMNGKLHAV